MAKSEPILKIGFVLDGGLEKPDGVQQYILSLGNWFMAQGHRVRYLVAGPVPKAIKEGVSLSPSIKVVSNGNRLSMPLLSRKKTLANYLEAEQFDVLHVQTPYSPLMGERLIFLSNKRTAIIGTYHVVTNSWYLSIGNRLLGLWCRFSLKRFDRMFSVSKAAQAVAKRDFKIDSDILPNVINYDLFNKAKPFSKYDDSRLTILFLGRLVPRKGCQLLLSAVNELVKQAVDLPKFKVVICGSGPLEKSLKSYVEHNDLDDIVEFVGFVSEEDKPRYYASADLAVFPSSGGESFGIVLIEAMASGKAAVLAADNIGYTSVMGSQPSLLFEVNSLSSLSDKLKEFLKDESLRKEKANWGRNYAKQFDVKVIGSKLIKVYKEILLNKSK
jgi:phosphatidylinositol alpha-mannosyltransferase